MVSTLPALSEPEPSAGHPLFVLNIQRTCVHDGPGVRTVVFFRGCRMRCRWCHNPEAQAFGVGSTTTVDEVAREVLRDSSFFRRTHGGVTLSGGEPMMQRKASLVALLRGLRERGVDVAVETAADAPWTTIEACLPYVNLFLVDLKAAREEVHERLTSRSFGTVEGNIRRLLAAKANVQFRMCVVPGHNDSEADIAAMAALLRSFGRDSIELLRYHGLHEGKAERLGLSQDALGIDASESKKALERVAALLVVHGVAARVPAGEGRARVAFGARVSSIRKAIRESGHHVCVESALLKTAFYQRHGFDDPVPIHRARALRHMLGSKTVAVYADELLVGNFTSKRVGGNVWVEYFGTTMAVHFWRMNVQKPVAFECTKADKLRFYFLLLPFWMRHSLVTRAFDSPLGFARFAARTFDKRAGFNNNMAAVAHYVVNCERLLALGTRGLATEVRSQLASCARDRVHFYEGVLIALRALEEFAGRYARELREKSERETNPKRRKELLGMARVCDRVPRHPASTFHEALQCILFWQIALCTESFENAISLGRLDKVLQPYYEADREAARLDYESARELLACFVLKFDEVIFLNDGDSALQLGKLFESLSPVETVTMGGMDQHGRDITNDVTYMLLDVCELRPIGVNMAARIHPGSPARYVERIAEVYLGGSPMPALYNDDRYIAALLHRYATPPSAARNYSIVGCVEPVASDDHFANTDCANVNVALPFLQALKGETGPLWNLGALDRSRQWLWHPVRKSMAEWGVLPADLHHAPPESLDELFDRFRVRLNDLVAAILADHQVIERALARDFPTPLASSLFPGCLSRGLDVYDGGASINSSGIQAVGITDVADSLAALEEVVFEKKLYTIDDVLHALDAGFEGEKNQAVRARLLAVPKFGCDSSDRAHVWVNRVLQAYVNALDSTPHPARNGRYVAGYYGLNVNSVYGKRTPALPSGRLGGTPLANSICPHYGMQHVDLTSSLNSVARVDFAAYAPNGTTLTSTIDAAMFPAPNGATNLAGLFRGYFDLGGMQLQPNLVSRDLLLDAYANPGKHKDLVVRIAGYCAYFDDLSDDLKREIVNRTYYGDCSSPTFAIGATASGFG